MQPFFLASGRGAPARSRDGGAAAQDEPNWSDIFNTVARAGHGRACDLGRLYTERQLMALHDAEKRRDRHARADLIDAIAAAYGGCRSDKGLQSRRELLRLLRQD